MMSVAAEHAFIGDNRTRACLHNLFDLNKCYGIAKFVLVIPSVEVRDATQAQSSF